MLPIACKYKGRGGGTWGPNPWGGGETEDGTIYRYIACISKMYMIVTVSAP